MNLPRRTRFVAALIALISVLFTQLAVAAYVCPSVQVAQAIAASQRAAMDHHDPSACDEAGLDQSLLCQAHVQAGTQSLDKPPLPEILPFVAVSLLVSLDRDDALSEPAFAASPRAPTRITAPSLSIQNCCFRI